MPHDRDHLPLVYSCSGCSSAAQLANHLAVRLDRSGIAEMSCIAGIGGNVRSLVAKAREAVAAGRPVLALDGCSLACARASLAERGLKPTVHVRLDEQGVKKQLHEDYDAAAAAPLYDRLLAQVQAMAALTQPVARREGGCGGGGCKCAGEMAA